MEVPENCSRCSAEMPNSRLSTPRPMALSFTKEGDGGALYQTETRVLCSGCEDDLLEWIDTGEIDRSECVDMPTKQQVTNKLQYAIEDMERTLKELDNE